MLFLQKKFPLLSIPVTNEILHGVRSVSKEWKSCEDTFFANKDLIVFS